MSIWPPMAPAVPLVLLTAWQVFLVGEFKIRQVFEASYLAYSAKAPYLSNVQRKAAHSILKCKSPSLGCNVSRCDCCGHMEFHTNSCRNRSCPNCQAVLKEGPPYLEPGAFIPCPYALYCLRRRAHKRSKDTSLFRKVFYSGQGSEG